MTKVVLVTGGAGFIGSNLIDSLLVQNYRVICLDNFDRFYPREIKEGNIRQALTSPLFTLIDGDIRNVELLTEIFTTHRVDIVVHLAAKAGVRPSILNPAEYFEINVNGTLCLLEVMKNHGVKNFIFASSSSIYGNNKKVPYAESDVVDFPISPYAASKKSGELLTHLYHHLYKFSVINLRLFTVYGPRQRPDLAINKFIKKLYSGSAIEVYGDGTTSRDYTYVADTVSGIQSAMNYVMSHENVFETINLGSNSPVKLSELISHIEEVTHLKFRIQNMPMQEGDVMVTFADISKGQQLLGYAPQTLIQEGLQHFKEWFENHGK